MTFQTLGGRSIHLSYGELCHGERGHNILSSYLTRVLHTARINVDVTMCGERMKDGKF